ncbi:MAG: DUF4835 family protein [Bacteroidota bacterium]
MRKVLSLFLVFAFGFLQAQELNCTVTVNADQIGATNNQVYKTLEKSLNDFVNKTDWTGQKFKQSEKINCSMYITVSGNNSDQFAATIQVQSSRPVYNSSYSSPVFNFNDKDFTFKYVEFQNLTYTANSFDSNLVSIIAFYSYMIIGIDADTFSPQGGTKYFEMAQDVASIAIQGGYKGWSQADGNQNRYFLITDMISNTFSPYREAMYEFHYEGLDIMHKDLKSGKEKVKSSIATLAKIYSIRPNAFLTRVFFDSKSDEIVSIFSGGPAVPITDLVDNLNRISPINSNKWGKIKL